MKVANGVDAPNHKVLSFEIQFENYAILLNLDSPSCLLISRYFVLQGVHNLSDYCNVRGAYQGGCDICHILETHKNQYSDKVCDQHVRVCLLLHLSLVHALRWLNEGCICEEGNLGKSGENLRKS